MQYISLFGATFRTRWNETSSASISGNPAALRLYKVLSSPSDDDATCEALLTLPELYTPRQRSKGQRFGRYRIRLVPR